jgi:hypothetical protein
LRRIWQQAAPSALHSCAVVCGTERQESGKKKQRDGRGTRVRSLWLLAPGLSSCHHTHTGTDKHAHTWSTDSHKDERSSHSSRTPTAPGRSG